MHFQKPQSDFEHKVSTRNTLEELELLNELGAGDFATSLPKSFTSSNESIKYRAEDFSEYVPTGTSTKRSEFAGLGKLSKLIIRGRNLQQSEPNNSPNSRPSSENVFRKNASAPTFGLLDIKKKREEIPIFGEFHQQDIPFKPPFDSPRRPSAIIMPEKSSWIQDSKKKPEILGEMSHELLVRGEFMKRDLDRILDKYHLPLVMLKPSDERISSRTKLKQTKLHQDTNGSKPLSVESGTKKLKAKSDMNKIYLLKLLKLTQDLLAMRENNFGLPPAKDREFIVATATTKTTNKKEVDKKKPKKKDKDVKEKKEKLSKEKTVKKEKTSKKGAKGKKEEKQYNEEKVEKKKKKKTKKEKKKLEDTEKKQGTEKKQDIERRPRPPKILRYRLSDPKFIPSKITAPPFDIISYKLISFEAKPARSEWNCFRERAFREVINFPGKDVIAAELECDGTGRINYPTGEPAIVVSTGRLGKRVLIFSQSRDKLSENIKIQLPIGLFDMKGNGVIYNKEGKIRLIYDQAEGIVYDMPNGVPFRWKWRTYDYVQMRRKEFEHLPPDPDDWEPEPQIKKDNTNDSVEESDFGHKKRSKGTKVRKGRKTSMSTEKKAAAKTKKSSKSDEKKSDKSKIAKSQSKKKEKGKNPKSPKLSVPARKKNLKDTVMKNNKTLDKEEIKKKLSVKDEVLRRSVASTISSALGSSDELDSSMDFFPKVHIPVDTRELPILTPAPKNVVSAGTKPISFKVADFISLRILDQNHIHLNFHCSRVHLISHIGVNINPDNLERIDKVGPSTGVKSNVPCYFELANMRTRSLRALHTALTSIRQYAFYEKWNRSVKNAWVLGYPKNLLQKTVKNKKLNFELLSKQWGEKNES